MGRGRGGLGRAHLDLRLLAILLAWAALPTATLVAGSLVQPVFLDRYVASSVPGLAIALALLAAWAFNGIAVRVAVRLRDIVESAALGTAAVVLFFAFSVPAAQLTYGEAISQGLPGAHRVAIIDAEGGRCLEIAELAKQVRQEDGWLADGRTLAAQAAPLKAGRTGAGP